MKEINKNTIMKEINHAAQAAKEENLNGDFTISGEGACSAEFAQGCLISDNWDFDELKE